MAGAGLPWPEPEWEQPAAVDPDAVEALRRALKLPRALCALLAVRGFSDPDAAKSFLRPLLDGLNDPAEMADGPKAAARISEAIDAGERIFVHGDYDVDGISSVGLVTRWLRAMGADVVPFVPHRTRDGYDLSDAGIDAAVEAGASILLTADCGIRAHEAVARAVERGLDVLVTDHHTPADTLPPAQAVVNPNRADCPYPNKALCGAGVVFQLCRLVARLRGRPDDEAHRFLDLVALATVADLVPLVDENRVLVRFGLRAMEQTANPGLRALMVKSDVRGEVDAGQVGFRIGPRINAVGRMADAKTAVELLLTDDPTEAERLAGILDDQNRQRREEEQRTLDAALAALEERFDPARDFGIVVDGEGWHPGVIGIVASRLVERVHRPTVMVARDGERGRGSARSVPGFHLLEAVEACGPLLDRFGGHKQAAGMDVSTDRIEAFREAFNEEATRRFEGHTPRPRLRADLEIDLGDCTDEMVHYLQYVGPFGIGNPGPSFVARGLEVVGDPRVVGKGHLKLELEQDGARLGAIGFGLADRVPPGAIAGRKVDVLFKLKRSEFRGRSYVEAHLRDIRVAAS